MHPPIGTPPDDDRRPAPRSRAAPALIPLPNQTNTFARPFDSRAVFWFYLGRHRALLRPLFDFRLATDVQLSNRVLYRPGSSSP
jgi:hypothetical protein